MQQNATPPAILSTVSPYLASCYTNIIWSCLDSDLPKSAVFYAERYYALDHDNHDARHIYATALLRAGQTHSALFLLRDERCTECSGCQQLKAQTCNALGRYRQAREALEESLKDPHYVPTRKLISYDFLSRVLK
jgi:anaphase-promoting complex subunit 3